MHPPTCPPLHATIKIHIKLLMLSDRANASTSHGFKVYGLGYHANPSASRGTTMRTHWRAKARPREPIGEPKHGHANPLASQCTATRTHRRAKARPREPIAEPVRVQP